MTPKASTKKLPVLRLSIRLKLLSVIATVVLFSLAIYLYLATSMFTRDKLTYVFDLNAALVETLSEQTRSSLSVLVQLLAVVDLAHAEKAQPQTSATAMFRTEPHLLRLQVFHRHSATSPFVLQRALLNEALLSETGLSTDDLHWLDSSQPIPFEAITSNFGDILLENTSLPPDNALLRLATSSGDHPNRVVVALFRHERLLRFFGKSPLHETYLVNAEGQVLAHPNAEVVLGKTDFSPLPLVHDALDSAVLTGVREFHLADSTAMLGAYAKVGMGRLVVLTQIPKKEALRAAEQLKQRSLLFALVVLLAAVVASVVLSRLLTAPIRRLSAATLLIGKGQFDVHVDVHSRDEIGDLAQSIRQMAGALKETQIQLIHSEKLAAFGQLGAGITHEVKNPMTAIIGFAQLAQRRADNPQKVQELLEIIEKEGKRCQEILVNFLKFAQPGARKMSRLQVNKEVHGACRLFAHQLNMHGVKFELQLSENLPEVLGNAGELHQVLLNLVMNAQQAMTDGGKVILSTRAAENGDVAIEIVDNGPGIAKDIQGRIFEPFFTTKAPGEGTGLGLSICFRIIRDHHGNITVQSQKPQGTRFIITLPACGEHQDAA